MWGLWGAKAAKGSLGLPYGTLQTAFSSGHTSLATHCPQSRFQTAVSTGCLWKAPGHSGQVITPIHTELQNKDHVIEPLHRAKFKFPGHQKISISKEWDLTKFNAEEFEDMAAETWLIPEDCRIKSIHYHGPLDTGPIPSSLRPYQ